MRQLKWLLLLSCIAATALNAQVNKSDTYTGPKDKLHVYLLIGQSNMAGRAPFSGEEAATIDRCYLLNDKDAWEPARNPLNRYSTIRKGLDMQKMNPGFGFSKTMLEANKGISIGLVVNAKGGTKIEQWKKGSQFYSEAIRRTKEAEKTGTLKGILWHQGESDGGNPDGYADKLKALVGDLRKDLNNPDLPFVAGEVFYDAKKKPGTKAINDELNKLPGNVPLTACVSAKGLTTADNTHFDNKGMKQLGERYAEEMLKLLTKTR